MEQREEVNIKEILRASRMGMWRVEMEEGKPPRFYADEVMDELLGIDREITPEERFVFHRSRIYPEDMRLFQEYSDKLTEARTEIVYRYSSGIRSNVCTLRWRERHIGDRICGCHRNTSGYF